MAKDKEPRGSTAMVPAAHTTVGVLDPADTDALTRLTQEGFIGERTFSIGPEGEKGKQPIYFGHCLGFAGDILVNKPGAVPDATGAIAKNPLPTFLFHPIDPVTFVPHRLQLDTIIASHQVAAYCRKYMALAEVRSKQTGRPHFAQILLRWTDMRKTRLGNNMNNVEAMHRIVPEDVAAVEKATDAGFAPSTTAADPAPAAEG